MYRDIIGKKEKPQQQYFYYLVYLKWSQPEQSDCLYFIARLNIEW